MADIKQVVELSKWTEDDCARWVGTLGNGYSAYEGFFRSEGVDGKLLMIIEDEDLRELGVERGIHRRKILSQLIDLRKPRKRAKKIFGGWMLKNKVGKTVKQSQGDANADDYGWLDKIADDYNNGGGQGSQADTSKTTEDGDFVMKDFPFSGDQQMHPLAVVTSDHMLESVFLGNRHRDGDILGCVFAMRDIRTGQVLARYGNRDDSPSACVRSIIVKEFEGTTYAIIGTKGSPVEIRIWNLRENRCERVIRNRNFDFGITALVDLPGPCFLSGDPSKTLRMWTLDGSNLWSLSMNGQCKALATSPDQRRLAAASHGSVRIFQVHGQSLELTGRMDRNRHMLYAMGASDTHIVSGGDDKKIVLCTWDGTYVRESHTHADRVNHLNFVPGQNKYFVSCAGNPRMTILWNIDMQKVREFVAIPMRPRCNLSFLLRCEGKFRRILMKGNLFGGEQQGGGAKRIRQ